MPKLDNTAAPPSKTNGRGDENECKLSPCYYSKKKKKTSNSYNFQGKFRHCKRNKAMRICYQCMDENRHDKGPRCCPPKQGRACFGDCVESEHADKLMMILTLILIAAVINNIRHN